MAKKSLILSNDDGRVTFTNTGSISIDDVTLNVSASILSASVVNITGLASTGVLLMTASNGRIGSMRNATVNNSPIVWNGTVWTTSSSGLLTYGGNTGGDISGSADEAIKVLSVANVNSGTLPVVGGGTGVSLTSGSQNLLIASASAGNVTFRTLTAASGSNNTYNILQVRNKTLVQLPLLYPDVRFYDTPGSYTWTKPTGARFVRIIMQGGGGGGGGGQYSTTWRGGGGGASGGYTDITIEASSISTATISVGAGGISGLGGNAGTSTAGGLGGTTSFVSGSISYSSTGGNGGHAGKSTPSDSTGGTGLTLNGYAGQGYPALASPPPPATSYFMPSGGGCGGTAYPPSQGGTVISGSIDRNFAYYLQYNGTSIASIPFAKGATGGSSDLVIPAQPGYGAGGGGGFANSTNTINGGEGGDGYALIISW